MNTKEFDKYTENVGAVMTMRLASLPMWWMTNPARAQKETRKMFSEKEDAFAEVQQQIMLAPVMFWLDVWHGFLRGDSDGGVSKAMQKAESSMIKPYASRVVANRKRLSKG